MPSRFDARSGRSHYLPSLSARLTALDPTSGMSVESPPHNAHEYDNATYSICSARPWERCSTNRTVFLGQPVNQSPPNAATAPNPRNGCPVGDDIAQLGPDICPECGMVPEADHPVLPIAHHTCRAHPEVKSQKHGVGT